MDTLLALDANSPKSHIFNIASGQGHTYLEMARWVEEIIPGPKISVGPGLIKFFENLDAPQKGALDIRRAETELGYKPRYGLFDGLKKYADQIKTMGID